MYDDPIEDLQTVLGGVCPFCGGDLLLERVGGTQAFLDEYFDDVGEDVKVDVWDPADEGTIGEQFYRCAMEPEDHTHSVFGYRYDSGLNGNLPAGVACDWTVGG